MARTKKPNEPARNYFGPARSYLVYVATSQSVTPRDGSDIFKFTLPKRLLLGFSLELYLKAYLRNAGVSTDDLQYNPYGHHIENLMRECLSKGLQADSKIRDAASQLGPMHQDFSYRYVTGDKSYVDMDYRYIIGILIMLDHLVAEALGIQEQVRIQYDRVPV